MPLNKIQPTIQTIIEEELKVLKEFTENKENESLSLLDLIGSEKSKKLLKETPTVQKILQSDEDLKIRQAIIDLFPEIKNKPLLIKSLDKAKEDFENTDDKGKAKIISAHKKDLKIDYQTIYIYLRILYRRDSIANLAKFMQLIDLATNKDNKKIIADHLQKKFSEMGSKNSINFNNLNTLPDWKQEIDEIKTKLSAPKVKSVNKTHPISNNSSITQSEENPLENGPKNSATILHKRTINDKIIIENPEPSSQLLDAFIEKQEQIIILEKALDFLSKEDNLLRTEKNNLEKEIIRLQETVRRLENEKLDNISRDSILNTLRSLKLPDINNLSKEHQLLKENKQKIETTLIEQNDKLIKISNQKTESDKQLLEAQQVKENLERNIGEIQTKFNEQTEISESLSLELESTKKLLEESQNNLSQKDDELQEKAIQLQATEKRVSELKSLQSDLNATNENITQLSTEQNSLKAEIVNLQNQNQKLTSEWQESLNQKAALESKLKILNEIIQNDKSANQKAIDQYTQESDELIIKHAKQENKIQDLTAQMKIKENQIKDLNETLVETKEKSERLENRSCDLEAQTIRQQQNIEQLANKETDLSAKIGELTKETENLNHIQETLEKSKNEITKLKKERDAQIATGSTSEKEISKLTGKISLLEEEKVSQENSINGLEIKIEEKDKEIKDLEQQKQQATTQLTDLQDTYAKNLEKLEKDLKASSYQAIRLQNELAEKTENIETLEEQKKLLAENLTTLNKELEKLNVELETTRENSTKIQAKLDNANERLAQSQEEINQLFNDNKKLKKEIETFQKNDSDLSNKCDTLKETLNTKTKEIDDLKNTVNEIQQQLNLKNTEIDNLSKQIKASENNKQILEKQLQELKDKKSPMPIQDASPNVKSLTDLHLSNVDEKYGKVSPSLSDSSSSLSTTSPAHTPNSATVHSHSPFHSASSLSESEDDSSLANSASSLDPSSPLRLTRSHNSLDLSFISGSGQDAALTQNNFISNNLIDLTTDSIEGPLTITSINGDTPMPTQQQQIDNLLSGSEFKNQLRSALAKKFEAVYVEACIPLLNTPEYSDINSELLLSSKNEVNKRNCLIVNAVTRMLDNEDIRQEIKAALYSEADADVLSPEDAANKFLNLFELNPLVDIGNYQTSLAIIRQTVIKNETNAKEYASLLNALGKECLSQTGKENIEKAIQTNLVDAFVGISPENRTEIAIIASQIVDETLNPKNVLTTLEKAIVDHPSDDLTATTKAMLINQCNEKIETNIETHFADIVIANILEKINKDKDLSDEEIQKIPSEIQYADTVNEFVSGLQVKYPHLSAFEKDDNNFKQLRLISRKKTLSAINQTLINDNEIIDLDSDAWLEKKLQLITGKSISLELIKLKKEQENLLNELRSSLHLSTLYDIAITGKTISELANEIDKANKAQSSAAEQISQIFQEIDRKQAAYPKLIDDKAFAGFRANLNQHLENSSINLEVDEEAAKILLMGINQRLKKDISKWDLLDNKFQKEITNDILINLNDLGFDKSEIETLVHHAMLVLRDNYPNDTVKKREQWLKDITLLHLATKELLAFSGKIEKNKAKFLDLKELKKQDPASQDPKEKISVVYLPRSCTLVANSSDSNFVPRKPVKNGFTVDTIFYKQNALEINQTLTFSQTLRNNKEIKWSVSRIDDTCLTYQTHKSWFDVIKSIKHSADNAMTYIRSNTDRQFNVEEEVLFTQLKHAIHCSKSKICKITISKDCSKQKERIIRCFINYHNKNKSNAEPILECQDNDTLKMHEDDRVNMMNKFETVSNIHAKELENVKKQSTELVNRHIRPRG